MSGEQQVPSSEQATGVAVDVDATVTVGGFSLAARFAVARGVAALFGPSGSGKSTALGLVAGLVRPTSGRVAIGGEVVAADGVHVPTQRRHVGLVLQEPALLPHRTVVDNVALGVPAPNTRERRRRAGELLEVVGVAALAGRRPGGLSGGEAQRVALARALASRPRLLLLDEPFTALDADVRTGLRHLVGEVARESGATVLIVTHDAEDVRALADQVVVFEPGRVAGVVGVDDWRP